MLRRVLILKGWDGLTVCALIKTGAHGRAARVKEAERC